MNPLITEASTIQDGSKNIATIPGGRAMDILYLSHCVPNPPNKGEKIRAHYEIVQLARHHRVHLCCFARSDSEAADAEPLKRLCASVYVEVLPRLAAPRALLSFALGACLNTAFYRSAKMMFRIKQLARENPLCATVVFSAVMGPFAPEGVPVLFDCIDVDSEKWLQYAAMRWPSFPYRLEARRMRDLEIRIGRQARCTFLSTEQEVALFRSFAAGIPAKRMENGVDFDYFSPQPAPPELAGCRSVVFVGAMDYYPNIDAACWFAANVLPELRRAVPEMEFWIVGRNPSRRIRKLARTPGILVTGSVSDTRPYIAAASAVVAPLRIARGIQNKVLEPLAMDKPVLVSPAVACTLAPELPAGITQCDSPSDYIQSILHPPAHQSIRESAIRRFSWTSNLSALEAELNALKHFQI
jgi:sugar transferase (PEP-CTERM/EpsH1 system associated)